ASLGHTRPGRRGRVQRVDGGWPAPAPVVPGPAPRQARTRGRARSRDEPRALSPLLTSPGRAHTRSKLSSPSFSRLHVTLSPGLSHTRLSAGRPWITPSG